MSFTSQKSEFHPKIENWGCNHKSFFMMPYFLTIHFEIKVKVFFFTSGPMLSGENLDFGFQLKIDSLKNRAVINVNLNVKTKNEICHFNRGFSKVLRFLA